MKIRLNTPINSSSGYSEMGRRMFTIISKENEVGCVDIKHQPTSVDLGPIAKQMNESKVDSFDFNLINMVPDLWKPFLSSGKNIGMTTFEADLLPTHWIPIMNKMSGIITTSEWNAEVMRKSGVTVPVLALSPVFESKSSSYEGGELKFGASFQWSKRKNYTGLIRAFCMAFPNKENVSLNIKTHIDGKQEDQIPIAIKNIVKKSRVENCPPIRLVTKNLSAQGNLDFLKKQHAHISLSHAEGWGLPAWEAAELGQPVILSDFGAYAEWGKAGSQTLVPCFLTNIYDMDQTISPFFTEKMRWGEPDLNFAAEQMQSIYKDYTGAKNKAIESQKILSTTYSMDEQVNRLKVFLERI